MPAHGGARACDAGAGKAGQPSREITATDHTSQADRALRALDAALAMRPPPHPVDLATIIKARLPLHVRIWLAVAATCALPADQAADLARAVLADLLAHRIGPLEAERQRQRRTYAKLAATIRRRG